MGNLVNKFNGLRDIWAFDNRWQLLWQRLLARGTGLTVYKMQGHELVVDHSAEDECGTRFCIVSDMYRKYLPLLKLQGPINVLDLGSNGGGFPLMLLFEGVCVAKLVCVEMNPQTYTRALLNISRNFSCRYRVINAAVSGTNTTFDLRLGRGGTSDSLYKLASDADQRPKRNFQVPGITLADIGHTEFPSPEIVNLCKMDVEGAEFEIINASSSDLLKRVANLIIEIHHRPGCDEAKLLESLSQMGFVEVITKPPNDPAVHLFRNSRLK